MDVTPRGFALVGGDGNMTDQDKLITVRDIPYILFIIACFVAMFFVGRLTAPPVAATPYIPSVVAASPSVVPNTAAVRTPPPKPVVTPVADQEALEFVRRWQEAETANLLREAMELGQSPPPAPAAPDAVKKAPAVPQPQKAPVPTPKPPPKPDLIVLEDDPTAIANPYKR